jgi:RNA polymerase-binding transcription factor DksA
MHTQETLKRSAKEDSGDLSGYSQHMADAGTDTFDRDFALSLVSNEQELLYEIEEALKRIRSGTYGTCEITGQTISADRLAAVPFTRYSLEGQKELEKQRKYGAQRGATAGLFAEATGEDAAALAEDDGDAS